MTGYNRLQTAEHIAAHHRVTLMEAYRLLELAHDDEVRVQRALECAAGEVREHRRPSWIVRVWRAVTKKYSVEGHGRP